VDQFDKLKKRNAFMDTYKKEAIFSDSLEEFDNSRETVQSLIEEYTAAEKENYLDWGTNEDVNEND
jgi:tubulin gamma